MTKIEILTYEGDGGELAELANRAWRATVGGKALFPLWSQEYFQWRLLDERGGGREFLVSAYQGDRLIGFILAEPLSFRVGGRHVQGTMSSWLTVDPDVRSPRLALRLLSELRRRHQERGMSFSMGFNDKVSRGFWESLRKLPPHDVHTLDRISMWTRVFDGRAVAASGLSRFERVGPPFAQRLPGLRPRPRSQVRPFEREADLERCRRWIEAQAAPADICIEWPLTRLELQLTHPYASTLVLDDGERGGFLNYYEIEMLGAREVRVGVIDLFAGSLGLGQKLALLQDACRRMREEGVHMAVMMKSAAAPGMALAVAGFIPYPADVELFWFFTDPAISLPRRIRHHVLFG